MFLMVYEEEIGKLMRYMCDTNVFRLLMVMIGLQLNSYMYYLNNMI